MRTGVTDHSWETGTPWMQGASQEKDIPPGIDGDSCKTDLPGMASDSQGKDMPGMTKDNRKTASPGEGIIEKHLPMCPKSHVLISTRHTAEFVSFREQFCRNVKNFYSFLSL